jgi:hypothetical protein
LLKVAGGTRGSVTEDLSLRLQELMDKKKQSEETLSNILVPFGSPQGNQVANLK